MLRKLKLSDRVSNRWIGSLRVFFPLKLYEFYFVFIVSYYVEVAFRTRGSDNAVAILSQLGSALIFYLPTSDIVCALTTHLLILAHRLST